MRLALPLLALIAPAPALAASFDCMVRDVCAGGACDFDVNVPVLIEELGDLYRVSVSGKVLEGYATTTLGAGDQLSVVLPPQGPKGTVSGLISVSSKGEMLFTSHSFGAYAQATVMVGTCTGVGG